MLALKWQKIFRFNNAIICFRSRFFGLGGGPCYEPSCHWELCPFSSITLNCHKENTTNSEGKLCWLAASNVLTGVVEPDPQSALEAPGVYMKDLISIVMWAFVLFLLINSPTFSCNFYKTHFPSTLAPQPHNHLVLHSSQAHWPRF